MVLQFRSCSGTKSTAGMLAGKRFDAVMDMTHVSADFSGIRRAKVTSRSWTREWLFIGMDCTYMLIQIPFLSRYVVAETAGEWLFVQMDSTYMLIQILLSRRSVVTQAAGERLLARVHAPVSCPSLTVSRHVVAVRTLFAGDETLFLQKRHVHCTAGPEVRTMCKTCASREGGRR